MIRRWSERLRPLERTDVGRVYDLAADAAAARGDDEVASREDFARQLDLPGLDITRHAWVLDGVEGQLDAVASAVPWPVRGRSIIHVGWTVRPAAMAEADEEELLKFAEDRAREFSHSASGDVCVRTGVKARHEERVRILERLEYRPVRWFLYLVRSLDMDMPEPEPPDGVTLVAADAENDAEEVFRILIESFEDHWDPPDITFEQFRYLLASLNIDPLTTILAREWEAEPAGLCIARVLATKNASHGTREGEITVLGVRRPYRHRGVGTSLLYAAMRWLREQGMDLVNISVDAQSPTGADRLYRRVGFTEKDRAITYEKSLG